MKLKMMAAGINKSIPLLLLTVLLSNTNFLDPNNHDFLLFAEASSMCGFNYTHAMNTCDTPCSHIGIDNDQCRPGQYCFGPNLPCTKSPTESPTLASTDGASDEGSQEDSQEESEEFGEGSFTMITAQKPGEWAADAIAPEPTSEPTSLEPTTATPTTGEPTTYTDSPTAAPTTEGIRLAEERRDMWNPALHYCGT